MNFADSLIDAIDEKENPSVVGLDPRIKRIPESIKKEKKKKYGDNAKAVAESFLEFNKGIIDAVKDIVPAVKPQMAFYECYGPEGVKAFKETCDYAKKQGLIVIEDAKRNDIGSTAGYYAKGHLGSLEAIDKKIKMFDVDAITVNSYLGSDGVKPFIEQAKENGKGMFLLVKTSNDSSGELQDKELKEGGTVYEKMAELVDEWGKEIVGKKGYSSVGAVVGATYPREAAKLRSIMSKAFILVPGYGAQGGGALDTMPSFDEEGYGAIVNSSRGIIFAYEGTGKEYDEASREAALDMKEDITGAMKEKGKHPW